MQECVSIARLGEVTQGMATFGRGAGARSGDWRVKAVTAGDVQDDRIDMSHIETIAIEQNRRTERHLLAPLDVVVAVRSVGPKCALVPTNIGRAVATASVAVIRPQEPELGAYLWYYLTSGLGRARLESAMVGSSSVKLLRASSLEALLIPLPDMREIHRVADLVEASERAYQLAIDAAIVRREGLRDAIVARIAGAAQEERQVSCR